MKYCVGVVFDFFVVHTEAKGLLESVVPYIVQPHAVVVRCALYVGGREALGLQYFDCTFALFLCHVDLLLVEYKSNLV